MTRDVAAPLPPNSCIGILGGGQLGRMLAIAAARLGFRVAVYSDADDSPAFHVADVRVPGAYDDLAALDAFAANVAVLTYEFENVPVAAAEHLADRLPVRPGANVLAVAQDRLVEKSTMRDLGIGTADFAAVTTFDDLTDALERIGAPAILKTRRLGYDGKGQAPIHDKAEAKAAFESLGGVSLILEKRVPFAAELSVIVVRGRDGQTRCYDCPRNEHSGGILRRSTVPGGFSADVIAEAHKIGRQVIEALDYIGVLAVELFHVPDEGPAALLVNEIAPRVHNSGHWTMDACICDQFENHIRAIAGWPIGSTDRHSNAVMENLIGADVHAWPALATEAGVSVHLYGKSEARAGRKMGHINRVTPR